MSDYIELSTNQGDDFIYTITITDDTTLLLINTANYIVTSNLKKSYLTANASGSFSANVTNTTLALTLAASNTANLDYGKYYFDVKVIAGGITSRIVQGLLFINPSVS